MTAHPLNCEVGLAGVGWPKHGDVRRSGIIGHIATETERHRRVAQALTAKRKTFHLIAHLNERQTRFTAQSRVSWMSSFDFNHLGSQKSGQSTTATYLPS